MANRIEIKFCFGQQTTIQFSYKDCFIFKVRAGKKLTKRTDNAASATREHSFWIFSKSRGVIFRKVATAVELVAAQDKATTFRGNVLHGGGPCGAMVSRGRTINLNALGIHKGAQQRHVVLPADYRAQLAQRSIKDWQS